MARTTVTQDEIIAAVTRLGFDPSKVLRIVIDGSARQVIVTERATPEGGPVQHLVTTYPWARARTSFLEPEPERTSDVEQVSAYPDETAWPMPQPGEEDA